ncbi:predicted protein [Histoplasma mississippiense (nom. inval.)]|uniref:predicted protein n=1 Tax=Ajellomyces capsulatus (strain NAm1 / WU24) TaxID=2059318 RepID=UPI000157B44A|nr:predicted protein [Histoplasma mississippiense (nom. inval.)]EDN02547.1 predicted protein [Histoplasma mississippiense (nom. inval.)]
MTYIATSWGICCYELLNKSRSIPRPSARALGDSGRGGCHLAGAGVTIELDVVYASVPR